MTLLGGLGNCVLKLGVGYLLGDDSNSGLPEPGKEEARINDHSAEPDCQSKKKRDGQRERSRTQIPKPESNKKESLDEQEPQVPELGTETVTELPVPELELP
ncbi:hypothetical protein LXL04_039820 [Taraxacum kok-saghyz]